VWVCGWVCVRVGGGGGSMRYGDWVEGAAAGQAHAAVGLPVMQKLPRTCHVRLCTAGIVPMVVLLRDLQAGAGCEGVVCVWAVGGSR
jgi:hypothetical protein